MPEASTGSAALQSGIGRDDTTGAQRRILARLRARPTPRAVDRLAFLVIVALILVRSPYILVHGRFYAEEGTIYFQHMFEHRGVGSLSYLYGQSGYSNLITNIGAWLAAQAPLLRAPLVTTWLSFALILALVWIAVFWPSELLPTRASRVTAGVLLIVGTLAQPSVWMNTLEVQTYLAVAALLLMFVEYDRLSRARYATGAGMLAIAGLSGVYANVLAPLFVVRAFQDRSRRRIAYAAVLATATVIQLLVVIHLRASGQTGSTKLALRSLRSITKTVAGLHVSGFVVGPRQAESLTKHVNTLHEAAALTLFALFVLAFLVVLLVDTRKARVPMLLGAAFIVEEMLVNWGAGGPARFRFTVVPIAILTLALVHGAARATHRVMRMAAQVGIALVLVSGLANYWTFDSERLRCEHCPVWADQVHEWRSRRTDQLGVWPYPTWCITLPRGPDTKPAVLSPGCAAPGRDPG
jgi:hypothetical protein